MNQIPDPFGVLGLQPSDEGSSTMEPVTVVLPAGLELRIISGGSVALVERGRRAEATVPRDDPTSPSPRQDDTGGRAGQLTYLPTPRTCVPPPPPEPITIALPVGLEIRVIVGGSVAIEGLGKPGLAGFRDDPTSPSPRHDNAARVAPQAKPPGSARGRKPSPRG